MQPQNTNLPSQAQEPENREALLREDLLRAECEHYMSDALHDALPEYAERRLAELFTLFPDLEREFSELPSAITALRLRYTAPERSTTEWMALESRITSRLEQIPAQQAPMEQQPLDQPEIVKKKASILYLPIIHGFLRFAAVAAVFCGGILLGRQSQAEQAINTLTDTTPFRVATTDPAVQRSDIHDFLQDAHLLMLGVMAMNAECGVSHPETLIAQRERCVELMARAQELRQSLSPEERARLAHVIVQVESALVELAGTQPSSVNASTIRHVQARTDDALCEVNTALAAAKNP